MHDETARPSSRKLLKGGLIILLIVAMAFSAGVGYAFERIEMLFYPRHYANEVDEAAAKFGMEPNLIYAIIKASIEANPRLKGTAKDKAVEAFPLIRTQALRAAK